MTMKKVAKFACASLLAVTSISAAILAFNKNVLQRTSGYSTSSLPTTIDLNKTADVDIRSYYSSCNGLAGDDLLIQLKQVLSNGQKYYNYDSGSSIWQIYEIADRDWVKSPAGSDTYGTYNDATKKITGYTYGTSNTNTNNNPYVHALYVDRNEDNPMRAWGNHDQTYGGINREHIWPKSHGFDTKGAAGARGDPMHLWAADGYTNNIHSNYAYGYVNKSKSYVNVSDTISYAKGNYRGISKTLGSGTVFEPQDSDKGDIARACFYMVARYNNLAGNDNTIGTNNPNLTLTNSVPSTSGTSTSNTAYNLGILSDLLAWHKADPVDDYEIKRNDILYTNYTNNRNPFIDFPDWVDYIWGDKASTGTVNPSTNTIHAFDNGSTPTPDPDPEDPDPEDPNPSEELTPSSSPCTISYGDTFDPALPTASGSVNSSSTSHNDETANITFKEQGIYKGGSADYIMFSQNKGFLYNTTDLGTITSVSVTYSSGCSTTAKSGVYFGSSEMSTYTTTSNQTIKGQSLTDVFTNNVAGNGYFQLSTSNKNCQITNITIAFQPYKPVTGVTLDAEASVLEVGQKDQLTATVLPEDAINQDVTWESSDESVVAVDENGLVTAIGAGTAVVSVETDEGGFTASCEYTVEEIPDTPTPISIKNLIPILSTLANKQETDREYTVKGTVTGIYSNSCYIQNDGYGMYIYNRAVAGNAVGKVVEVTGTFQSFNGQFETKNISSIGLIDEPGEQIDPYIMDSTDELSSEIQNTVMTFRGLEYVSGTYTVGSSNKITFNLDGNEVAYYSSKYLDDDVESDIKDKIDYIRANASDITVNLVGAHYYIFGNTNEFVVYEASQIVVVPNDATDKEIVQSFVDDYMHMTDYDASQTGTGTNACLGADGYYMRAKKQLTILTDEQISLFQSDNDFNDAQARYEAWAAAYGDLTPYAPTVSFASPMLTIAETNNTTFIVIIVISMITTTTACILLKIKKKHE